MNILKNASIWLGVFFGIVIFNKYEQYKREAVVSRAKEIVDAYNKGEAELVEEDGAKFIRKK